MGCQTSSGDTPLWVLNRSSLREDGLFQRVAVFAVVLLGVSCRASDAVNGGSERLKLSLQRLVVGPRGARRPMLEEEAHCQPDDDSDTGVDDTVQHLSVRPVHAANR